MIYEKTFTLEYELDGRKMVQPCDNRLHALVLAVRAHEKGLSCIVRDQQGGRYIPALMRLP